MPLADSSFKFIEAKLFAEASQPDTLPDLQGKLLSNDLKTLKTLRTQNFLHLPFLVWQEQMMTQDKLERLSQEIHLNKLNVLVVPSTFKKF